MKKVVKNMKELRSAVMKEIEKAMYIVSEIALADMQEETYDFYTGGEPVRYQRTGALGDTPKTTPQTVSDKTVSFDAYLDLSHTYTTGKMPTMLDVLRLTNDRITDSSVGYLRYAVGKPHYWDRAEVKMEKSLQSVMEKFFEPM